jgi:hypothetical protein
VANRKPQMTRHILERRHRSRRARLETWTLIEELIDDFDTTREEGGEEVYLEIATSDSLRPTAHHEDKENAGIAMVLAERMLERKGRKSGSWVCQGRRNTYTARPPQTNPSKLGRAKSFF